MKEQVEAALGEIRPMLQADGGDIELVEVKEDGQVHVRLQGACAGCPGAMMTLKMGVERILKERIPEVTEVVAVGGVPGMPGMHGH
ncbi:MAG: NifU family protein [Deltaproteobacteria bacterium]|jgi:Fe-S cluster biogenesis protein NfuA|nr:NifU family protein [Deltaproteobacteria bacterium]MBW2536295.1 NifU family protein [Deltaproteobacteria bacterium]